MAHRRHTSRSNAALHAQPHKRKSNQRSLNAESYEQQKRGKEEAVKDRRRNKNVMASRLKKCLRMAEREVESVEDAELLSESEKYLQLKVLLTCLFKLIAYDHQDTILQTGKTLLGQFKEAEAARGAVARAEIKDVVGQWHLGYVGTHDCISSVAHPFCMIDDLKSYARRTLIKDLPELEADLILKMVVAASVAFRSKQRRECDACLEGKHTYATLSYEKAIKKVKNDMLKECIYTEVSAIEVESKFGERMVELTGFLALYLSYANVYNAADIQSLVISLPLVLENYALWRKKSSWMKACAELVADLDVFRYRKAMHEEATSSDDSDSIVEIPVPRLRGKLKNSASASNVQSKRTVKESGITYEKAHDLVKECGIWSDHTQTEIRAKLQNCPRSFKILSELDPENTLWKSFLVGRVIKIARDMKSGSQNVTKKKVEADSKKITFAEYYKQRSGGKAAKESNRQQASMSAKPVISARKINSVVSLKRKSQFPERISKKLKVPSTIPPLEQIN